jgi:hypothetical protein
VEISHDLYPRVSGGEQNTFPDAMSRFFELRSVKTNEAARQSSRLAASRRRHKAELRHDALQVHDIKLVTDLNDSPREVADVANLLRQRVGELCIA